MNGYPNYTKYHTYTNLGTYRVTFTLTSGEYKFGDSRFSANNNRITQVISYGNQYLTAFNITKANMISKLPKNYPFRNGEFKLSNDEYTGTLNVDGLFSQSSLMGEISNCSFTRLEGDMFKGNDSIDDCYSSCIKNNTNLEQIDNIYLPNYVAVQPITQDCDSLHTIKSVTIPTKHGTTDMGLLLFGGNHYAIREMTITNLGDYSRYTIIKLDKLMNWGVNSTKVPKAKESLVASLITNTPDKSAEAKSLSIYLSANTKAALTDTEKAQITSKGYTIA